MASLAACSTGWRHRVREGGGLRAPRPAGKPAPHWTRRGGHRKNKPQRTRRRQTTEDTEKNRPRGARRWEERGRKGWSAHSARFGCKEGSGWGGHGKSKPQRTRRRQTTEGTENTEIGKEGADTLVRPYTARRWVAQRAVGEGGPRPAGKPAPHWTRHGGHRKNKPRRTRRRQTTEGTEDTEKNKPRRTRR